MPTKIEWAEETWNPVTGCDPVSAGCLNCYAEAITKLRPHQFPNGFKVTLHPDRLTKPQTWREPRRVFVCSMSDLFHPAIPHEFLLRIWDMMCATPQHTYMVLTKRSRRLADLAPALPWPVNIWAGVSVEKRRWLERVDHLRTVPAARRFISAEPLLEQLDGLDLTGINLVIVGGESGPEHRPIKVDWVRHIRDQCWSLQRLGAAPSFFFKQWGGRTPKAGGRMLDGRVHDDMPPPLLEARLL